MSTLCLLMSTDNKYLHSEITSMILQAFYTVHNNVTFGLTRDVYKRALTIECDLLGLKTETDKEIQILYKDKVIGSFVIDLVVNDCVIVRVFADEKLNDQHDWDSKNQLRLTEYEVCLILNFAEYGEHKRLFFTNDIKKRK